jgi:DNA-binding NarL/FixJ family response regulator
MSNNVPVEVIRVFLLIENRLLREALVRLFRKRGDMLVVGESGQTDLTPEDIFASNCDVLVIASFQTNWRGRGLGFAVEKVRQLGLRVVLIGMDADENQFMSSVRSGVSGYLLKDASAFDVVSSVRAVFRGEAVCPPQLCHTLFRFVAESPREAPAGSPVARPELTLRQQQLVGLVAQGLTNKEIASRLNLSEFTVRNHIHRILRQVDAESRSEAVETIRACGYTISS